MPTLGAQPPPWLRPSLFQLQHQSLRNPALGPLSYICRLCWNPHLSAPPSGFIASIQIIYHCRRKQQWTYSLKVIGKFDTQPPNFCFIGKICSALDSKNGDHEKYIGPVEDEIFNVWSMGCLLVVIIEALGVVFSGRAQFGSEIMAHCLFILAWHGFMKCPAVWFLVSGVVGWCLNAELSSTPRPCRIKHASFFSPDPETSLAVNTWIYECSNFQDSSEVPTNWSNLRGLIEVPIKGDAKHFAPVGLPDNSYWLYSLSFLCKHNKFESNVKWRAVLVWNYWPKCNCVRRNVSRIPWTQEKIAIPGFRSNNWMSDSDKLFWKRNGETPSVLLWGAFGNFCISHVNKKALKSSHERIKLHKAFFVTLRNTSTLLTPFCEYCVTLPRRPRMAKSYAMLEECLKYSWAKILAAFA